MTQATVILYVLILPSAFVFKLFMLKRQPRLASFDTHQSLEIFFTVKIANASSRMVAFGIKQKNTPSSGIDAELIFFQLSGSSTGYRVIDLWSHLIVRRKQKSRLHKSKNSKTRRYRSQFLMPNQVLGSYIDFKWNQSVHAYFHTEKLYPFLSN